MKYQLPAGYTAKQLFGGYVQAVYGNQIQLSPPVTTTYTLIATPTNRPGVAISCQVVLKTQEDCPQRTNTNGDLVYNF